MSKMWLEDFNPIGIHIKVSVVDVFFRRNIKIIHNRRIVSKIF